MAVDLWQELTPDFKRLSNPLFKKRVKQYLLIANEQPRKRCEAARWQPNKDVHDSSRDRKNFESM